MTCPDSPATMRPSVAVLMAAYRGAPHLRAQVHSILGQEGVDVTLVIRVDPSPDDTLAICEELAAERPEVIVRTNSESSGGAAQNFFTLLREDIPDACTFVALSDQDDLWLPDKLARSVQRLTRNAADAYSSNVYAWWPGGTVRLIDKAQPQRRMDHRFSAPGPGCTFVLSAPVARLLGVALTEQAEIARRLPLHDWLIYAWFRHQGYTWTIDPTPTLFYRQHGSNVIGVNVGLAALRQRLSSEGRRWYVAAAADITTFLARTTHQDGDPPAPLTTRVILRRWRDLRRPISEAAICAVILLSGRRRPAWSFQAATAYSSTADPTAPRDPRWTRRVRSAATRARQ